MSELQKTLESVKSKSFLVEIFGLGYVGFPLAVRLANSGINVRGIDVNPQRIERLQNNKLMDSELQIKNEFLNCRENKNLELAKSPSESQNPKIGIICVPTPMPEKNDGSNVFVKKL